MFSERVLRTRPATKVEVEHQLSDKCVPGHGGLNLSRALKIHEILQMERG